MKYANMIIGLALIATVAFGAQKTTLTQREVRDPRQLQTILESNALDAETRLVEVYSLFDYLSDGLLSIATLDVSATTNENFKTTTTSYYRIGGIQYSKNATDNLAFSQNDTINTGDATNVFYGGWAVQINAAGAVSTLAVTGQTNAVDQVLLSEAAALASAQAVVPTTGNIAVGYIVATVDASTNGVAGATWTANTDDLDEAVFVDAVIKELP